MFRRNIERMAHSIAHRGPDDEGYYVNDSLGFGFRRLSIIDLAGGHQPMSDAEESVWVVFNGEIYNFPELKEELQAHGHVFRTRSDTEVIVHGYKQWGDDVLNHLNGMFGLAIWDVTRKRLVLARDPFGIKLIYYRLHDGCLYFGSEIRAVLAGIDERPEADPNSLNLFLRYRFTPSPHTMFRGICKLAAGSMLKCERGTCSVHQWYNYRPTPSMVTKSDGEVRETLLELYRRSMKRHLLSDVPVGLLLSGGIDSGLLLALMNIYGNGWRTYTVGYGATFSDDELSDAERTAALFSSQHTSVLLDRRTFEETLRHIVSFLEEPVAASSIVPMYFVSQRAREDVKVVLIGQGPDELFAGYPRHLGVRYSSFWGSLPAWIRNPLELAISTLPRNETLKRGLYSLKVKNRTERYQYVLSLLPGKEIENLFEVGLLGRDAGEALIECWKDLLALSDQTDELGGFQFLEVRSTLPDELLMYADKLSMAHGLEARVPYLDREIVEFVETLPQHFKIRRGTRKWVHRQVCSEFLPVEMLRRKKRGFAANVVDDWFRRAMSARMNDVLLDSSSLLYHYLQPAAVQRILREHQAGQNNHYKILFSLVVFEEWLRVHSFQDVNSSAVRHPQVAGAV